MTADAQKLADELVANCIVELRGKVQYMAIPVELFFCVREALRAPDAGAVAWPDNRCPQCGTVHPLLADYTRPSDADALLREIYDSGYIKTKVTSNDTELEDRVAAHLARSAT